jgi:two-component system, cell cycle sensor histidine kinase and response regulator CckA
MDSPNNEHLPPIDNSVQRMTQLTSQLLAYARGGKYQAEEISLVEFVRETLPLVQYTLKSSITMEIDWGHDTWNIKADQTQLQMALSAILSNSSESIEKNGNIWIACKNERVTDELAKKLPGLSSGNYVSLNITDNGKGMDEKTKNRIFEPFFTTNFTGRGLGMAAVYGIIKNHDGWISVESELGKGTIVKILLPVIEENTN